MYMRTKLVLSAIGLLTALALPSALQAQEVNVKDMTFFVTSKNPGKGADLGGLPGADAHCQSLANAAGAGARTWRAYLSVSATASKSAIDARDRIGSGPWQNARGTVIAKDVADLHSNNKLNIENSLTERGEKVKGRGDTPNMHDILTGSQPDGKALPASPDMTCGNWTISSDSGYGAIVGHHDRIGLRDDESSRSWNSSHRSRGCSAEALPMSGGAGLLYCFAAN